MEVLVSNLQEKEPVDISIVQQTALNILSHLKCGEQCELSIALIDDREMHRLNREYRGIDRSTDVLSFALQEAEAEFPIHADSEHLLRPIMLGDVIISTETTRKHAHDQGHSFEKELATLLIHGILHLLGYDHRTDQEAQIMENLEQTVLHALNINSNES